MDISFDFSIKFHYPYLFYGFEKNEIWVQRIDIPYEIRRYVFVNTITAFDHTDSVNSGDGGFPQKELGLILTYDNHHKIATFAFDENYAQIRRIQKPIKFTELPNSNITSFIQIEGKNEKNKLEP